MANKALPNPVGEAVPRPWVFFFLPDELACGQLVFPQRPVPPLDPLPLLPAHLRHLDSTPLRVESRLEQIHLQDLSVDIVADLSICNTILGQPVGTALRGTGLRWKSSDYEGEEESLRKGVLTGSKSVEEAEFSTVVQ